MSLQAHEGIIVLGYEELCCMMVLTTNFLQLFHLGTVAEAR